MDQKPRSSSLSLLEFEGSKNCHSTIASRRTSCRLGGLKGLRWDETRIIV